MPPSTLSPTPIAFTVIRLHLLVAHGERPGPHSPARLNQLARADREQQARSQNRRNCRPHHLPKKDCPHASHKNLSHVTVLLNAWRALGVFVRVFRRARFGIGDCSKFLLVACCSRRSRAWNLSFDIWARGRYQRGSSLSVSVAMASRGGFLSLS